MSLTISYVSDAQPGAKTAAAAGAGGTQYSLQLVNQSAQPWVFYVYQNTPQPSNNDWFSLAWFASPYKIRVGDQITFKWEVTYNFVWSQTGLIIPGVAFEASGKQDADPAGANSTIFSLTPGPGLSPPQSGPPTGSLVIDDAQDVPNNAFSVGIGMSGTGTYVQQAGTGLNHLFTPTPSYWIAAGTNVQVGTVLSIQTVTQNAQAKFPAAVYKLKGTLSDRNAWKIEPA